VCDADCGAAEAVVDTEFEPVVECHGCFAVNESHVLIVLHYFPPQQDFLWPKPRRMTRLIGFFVAFSGCGSGVGFLSMFASLFGLKITIPPSCERKGVIERERGIVRVLTQILMLGVLEGFGELVGFDDFLGGFMPPFVAGEPECSAAVGLVEPFV